jgi:hypothetical protein
MFVAEFFLPPAERRRIQCWKRANKSFSVYRLYFRIHSRKAALLRQLPNKFPSIIRVPLPHPLSVVGNGFLIRLIESDDVTEITLNDETRVEEDSW